MVQNEHMERVFATGEATGAVASNLLPVDAGLVAMYINGLA
jgi:hypothetical protein